MHNSRVRRALYARRGSSDFIYYQCTVRCNKTYLFNVGAHAKYRFWLREHRKVSSPPLITFTGPSPPSLVRCEPISSEYYVNYFCPLILFDSFLDNFPSAP